MYIKKNLKTKNLTDEALVSTNLLAMEYFLNYDANSQKIGEKMLRKCLDIVFNDIS